jgi:hypothetical protein
MGAGPTEAEDCSMVWMKVEFSICVLLLTTLVYNGSLLLLLTR